MKKTIIAIGIIIIGFLIYFATRSSTPDTTKTPTPNQNQNATTTASTTDDNSNQSQSSESTVIGKSVEGRDITAYHYGTGTREILFIGGIHGGYEWNTTLLAFEAMDYLKDNPSAIPANVKVTIIPVMNPDGLNKTVGTSGRFTESDVPSSQTEQIAGRFNGNDVDLGRNFDCDWQAKAKWQNKTVSGGTGPFSEPESQAIKKYVEGHNLSAVVTWYSAAGGVFASSCYNDVSAETKAITKKYAEASKYPAYESFDFYAITGDMVNWFAKKSIPAISVLLTNHTDTEWVKNQAGISAILSYYGK